MIVHEEKTNVIMGGNVGKSSTFDIEFSAEMANILSSGLYSDKVTAIVRELCCNAYDSHVAAGKENEPFYVKVPTLLDPEFVVEDFGIGLSDEDIREVYCTFFKSTKRDSNKFIGAKGLGSKSPFSYIDSFNLVSCFEGKKRIYVAHKNESGLPAITLISETDTDQCNGIRVSFPVRKEDHKEFKEKIQKVLFWFKNQNDESYKVESDYQYYDGWYRNQYQNNIFGSGVGVLMGNVYYPVPVSTFTKYLPEDTVAYKIITENGYIYGSHVFEFGIGELDVTPSRESISFDVRSVENFKNKIESTVQKFTKDIQDGINQCENIKEVFSYIGENKLQLYLNVLTFSGYRLSDLYNYIFSCDKDKKLICNIYKADTYKRNIMYHGSKYSERFSNVILSGCDIIVDDLKNSRPVIDRLMAMGKLSKPFYAINVKNSFIDSKSGFICPEETEEEIQDVLNKYCLEELPRLSELNERYPKTKEENNKTTKTYGVSTFHDVFNGKNRWKNYSYFDLDTKGYFIKNSVYDGLIESGRAVVVQYSRTIIKYLFENGKIEEFLVVKNYDVAKFRGAGWTEIKTEQELKDIFVACVDNLYSIEDIRSDDYMFYRAYRSMVGDRLISYVENFIRCLDDYNTGGVLKECNDYIDRYSVLSKTEIADDAIPAILELVLDEVTMKRDENRIEEYKKEITEKFELIFDETHYYQLLYPHRLFDHNVFYGKYHEEVNRLVNSGLFVERNSKQKSVSI